MTVDPRKTALMILNELDSGHSHLDRIVSQRIDAPSFQMSQRDRRLAYALIYGVLRWRGRLDWGIRHFSSRPLAKIRPDILNVLRIGIYQILFMTRIPDSAAVNTSVEMTKEIAPAWIVRYVNGLLRNVCRKRNAIPLPDADRNPISALAVDQSFPDWIIDRWVRRFGLDETVRLCDRLNQIPLLTVRVNTGKLSRSALLNELKQISATARKTEYSPVGISVDTFEGPVHEMPAFDSGGFQIQDEAAQLVGYVLSPLPGETVLDACAGLGGKTGHIAQLMENSGSVVALDVDKEKLAILASEMERLGNEIVTPYPHDLSVPLPPGRLPLFDRILVDAPCSGLGVIRRNPDIKWFMHPERFNKLRSRQLLFLTHASQLLKPGGSLVYAVCSMEPEETTSVIDAFLATHPHFSMDVADRAVPAQVRKIMGGTGCFYTFPQIYDMDGFFIARMVNTA